MGEQHVGFSVGGQPMFLSGDYGGGTTCMFLREGQPVGFSVGEQPAGFSRTTCRFSAGEQPAGFSRTTCRFLCKGTTCRILCRSIINSTYLAFSLVLSRCTRRRLSTMFRRHSQSLKKMATCQTTYSRYVCYHCYC